MQSNMSLIKNQSFTITNLKIKNWWSSKRGRNWGTGTSFMIYLWPISSIKTLRYFVAAAIKKRGNMMIKTVERVAAWASWIIFCAVTLLIRTWPPDSRRNLILRGHSIWQMLHLIQRIRFRVKSLTLIKRKIVIVITATAVLVMKIVTMKNQTTINQMKKMNQSKRTCLLKNLLLTMKKIKIWRNPCLKIKLQAF